MKNENIRMGAPYDDPAFEALCREHDIWGKASAALCAVFWRKAGARQPLNDLEVSQMLDTMGCYCGEWEAAVVRATEARHDIA